MFSSPPGMPGPSSSKEVDVAASSAERADGAEGATAAAGAAEAEVVEVGAGQRVGTVGRGG